MVIRRKKSKVNEDRIYIGKIVKAHGLKGEIRVKPFGCPVELFEEIDFLYRDSDGEPLEIEGLRGTEDSPILKFVSIDDRNGSDELIGEVLWVHETDLPELDDGYLYASDILYAMAETEDGTILGKVEDIVETGATDVLVIRGGDKEILLPVHSDFVRDVIKEEKRVIVKLLEYEEPEKPS